MMLEDLGVDTFFVPMDCEFPRAETMPFSPSVLSRHMVGFQ